MLILVCQVSTSFVSKSYSLTPTKFHSSPDTYIPIYNVYIYIYVHIEVWNCWTASRPACIRNYSRELKNWLRFDFVLCENMSGLYIQVYEHVYILIHTHLYVYVQHNFISTTVNAVSVSFHDCYIHVKFRIPFGVSLSIHIRC